MGRRAQRALLNEQGDWVVDVLDAVASLRQAYRDRSRPDIDDSARQLRSLLRDEESRAALDEELKARRVFEPILHDEGLIRREASLGESFGYSRKEVLRYVRRARAAIAGGVAIPDIADTEQLLAQLQQLHDQAASTMSARGGWWARRRNAQRASSVAQDRLFAVGALVADVARRTLFDLSYSLAVVMLAEDVA